ncbi:MAG TPA: hypothetical protein VFZ21_25210 [Gemmatimonadaceae bacterium]|nr:hypothetical protein [Gemmatimonadaceae bacterium]
MRRLLIPLILVAATACQDLAVTNPNEPDRTRATQQPAAVEAFVASSFRTWWPVAGHDDYPGWALSTIAREVTSGFADFGQLELSTEPRSAWNNSPVNARNNVSEDPWYDLYSVVSTVNDALIAIDDGLEIGSGNTVASSTTRAHAFAKFMQALSYGYLGLYFDKAFIIDETTQLDTIQTPEFTPYEGVRDAAVAQLDAAVQIAQENSFTLPADQWLFTAMTRDQFVRLANSFAAKFIAYTPRTREERAAADWEEVIRRVDAGIQADFAPVAQPDILWDDWKRLVARVRNSARPSDFGRPSYWLIGPADATDGFVDWVATPVADRTAFQLQTQDRRIQGDDNPETPGTYVGFNENNIFAASRGTYRFSWYFFRRYGTGTSWQNGPQPAVTVTEMDLLKAEALIRLDRAAEAVPLINKSRVANGQLPPVTLDGPPNEPGCVPRKLNGECGSLWDALRYEKGIEMLGVDAVTTYFDRRGWQELPENSILQLPVPGRELGTLRLPLYTFGGPGGESSAPAPDPERCPVALPRCP